MKNIILGSLLVGSFFLVTGCVSSETSTVKSTKCSGGKCAKSKASSKCAIGKMKKATKCGNGKCASAK